MPKDRSDGIALAEHRKLTAPPKSDPEPHSNKNTTWEMYNDDCYYDMWAVRDTADTSFNSQRLFHFALHEDAKAFLGLIKKAW